MTRPVPRPAAARTTRRTLTTSLIPLWMPLLFLVAWLDAHAEPNERHAVPLRVLLPLARRRYQRHARAALN
jgi:hypothetical protein